MINEHEITQQAMEQARQIIDKAKAEAKEIIDSSYNYADRLLETVEKVSVSSMKELEQCISIVRSNRSELRNSDNATVVNEEPPTEEAE